jgi:integrase
MTATAKGHIEQLPSGSFRVHVYAGTDPVTGKPRRLKQTCPDEAAAYVALGRLLGQAAGDRFPDREATLGQALGKYLEVADLEVSTREAHEGYIRRTIGPVLGEVKIRKLGADSLDALYTALKKCSRLCGRLPRIEHHVDAGHSCDERCGPLRDHRTTRPHTCDDRCRPHVCRPMKPATILRIHSVISSALDLAVRYDWADRNVAKNARPPHPRKREPDPPTPELAARLLNLVWAEDEEFGLYLWTAITTGARRGEVSALRENRFDFARQQVRVSATYIVKQGNRIEKAPKDGEGRVLSLDLLTCELLRERFGRRRAEAQALGVQVPEDAFAFSPDPAGRTPWNPDTMTHRYRRHARRVGITSSLKELRHYSATQLLAAGTDLNTVAGRLGHAEGSTTLKFYAQFTRPADQHAAAVIPSQLDGLRRKERLRELYRRHLPASGIDELAALAAVIGPEAGLDEHTARAWLTEFASAAQNGPVSPG